MKKIKKKKETSEKIEEKIVEKHYFRSNFSRRTHSITENIKRPYFVYEEDSECDRNDTLCTMISKYSLLKYSLKLRILIGIKPKWKLRKIKYFNKQY